MVAGMDIAIGTHAHRYPQLLLVVKRGADGATAAWGAPCHVHASPPGPVWALGCSACSCSLCAKVSSPHSLTAPLWRRG